MDCSTSYDLKSRSFVGVADAGFVDAADEESEFSGKVCLSTQQQKVQGSAETLKMEEKQNLSRKSSMLSSKDDGFLLPGSSELQASTSESTLFSAKMGLPESRANKSGSNGTSNTIGAQKQVPKLSSVLGTASMSGFGKAVEILDTLGCLMTTLGPDGGFISRAKTKGCKISILAFEVANTILKGASIMQSLSEDTVTYFKQVVLPSEGVQSLVSDDMSELMKIVANDKREELKMFSQEIVRFGNRCKDTQWHNLDRYFLKLESENVPQKHLKETATEEMQKMMTLVQRTTELYHELNALNRFEQEYDSMLKGKDNTYRFEKGDNIQIIRLELKTQRSYVKNLKKKSLWSRTLEQVVEKLVDVVQYLHIEINNAFGSLGGGVSTAESSVSCKRLGPSGLALHYANIVIQIYSIVSRSGYVPENTRDALYQGLPPGVRSALPGRLRASSLPPEITTDQIRAGMDKTLKWLVPMAINTTCARGFLRFSEWAKSGTDRVGRRPGQADPIETLYHADKERTEAYILDLVVSLHHLVSQSSRLASVTDN